MTAAEWRISTALLLSGVVHGVVLNTHLSAPLPQPELHEAGRLSVHLSRGEPQEPMLAETQPPHSEAAPERQSDIEAPPPAAKVRTQPAASRSPLNPEAEQSRTEPEPKPARQRGEAPPTEAPPNEPVDDSEPLVHREIAPPKQPAPGARAAVRTRLEDELSKHFYYPFMARRRGWEGEVVLALRINPRGEVDSVEIANSSGHSVLDQAALDAISRVSRLPKIEDWLNGSELHLELPVIYRLREG